MEEQQKALEKELERVRKLDAMSTMACGIAHDFNNLLTIINGNVEMARVLSREQKIDQLLDETARALKLTNGLIRQFTTFSDNFLPAKTRVCVHGLLAGLLASELETTAIEYRLSAEDTRVCVDLDSDLILQVFHNIVLNAVEAMQGRGLLQVDLCTVDGDEEARCSGHPVPEGTFLRIRFLDTGAGIEEALLDQVFDPYFSTKQKGTQKGMGLGLTTTHAIVKKHGGFVCLESPASGGCQVDVYLPLGREQRTDAAPSGSTVPDCLRILIMDDDEMMRTILSKMFSHFNCQVTEVQEGEEAVLAFAAGRSRGMPYDLVLLDLQVDLGLGGRAAAEKIHALDPGAIMVAMSGNEHDEIMVRYAEHHFVAAAAKPFSLQDVQKMMNTYALHNTR